MDPVIFSIKLFGGVTLTLRWYGVLVMLGAVVGAWLAEKEIRRRGENGEVIWDALVWVLPLGIIGARLWYVMNSILGGSRYYIEDPVRIFYIAEGGLHFFGGLLFGAAALLIYLRRKQLDIWLFLDAIAPVTLIGQAIARPANFINQELYGQPTQLPWGIKIDAAHRLPQYADLRLFPIETTRFHPTFAYEMVWNFLAALLLIWVARQYAQRLKPGAIFGGWLVLSGLGRVIVEFFRPDQPRIAGTQVTYSALVAALMAVAGVIFLLLRFGKLKVAFAEGWAQEYRVHLPEQRPQPREDTIRAEPGSSEEEQESLPPKKRAAGKTKTKPASTK